MKKALLIIRGILIGAGSFEVQRLVYLYSTSRSKESEALISISFSPFPLSFYDFAIPVAILAMITKNWFSLDKLWMSSIAEGITISILYILVVFLLNLLNLCIGWFNSGEWGNEYFHFLPYFTGVTFMSFVIIPCVVLCVRGLIEKPLVNKLQGQFKTIMK